MACDYCQRTRAAMWQHFKDWYSRPFSADMSAGGWFAFLSLLIVISIMQGFILQHIRGK